jgi:ubiquinone/menaquinone biosynthesis C-methylase UbiE
MLDELAPRGRAVGVDFSPTALEFCRLRSSTALLQADGGRLPVGDGEVDAVTAIGVIEHLDDDLGALAEWHRVLRPGGGHDVSNHHTRRYRAGDVRSLLERTGFQPATVSYVNTILFPPIAVVRAAERLARRGRPPAPHKDTGEVPAPLNRALLGLLELERRAIARRGLPFGVSIVASAVAR